MRFRHFKGKQILAMVREGDYAHPGEEAAISLAMNQIPKDQNRLILDVGCGLGGTAKFIQDQDWGQVTGIDIEAESIAYAKKKYPNIEFAVCDVADAAKVLNKKFDLICIFGSFVVFKNQLAALQALRKLAHDTTQLIIFEYMDRNNYLDVNPPFNQVHLPEFKNMLQASDWKLTDMINLDAEYECWYLDLINRIEAKRHEIIKAFGNDAYKQVHKRYMHLLKGIQDKNLGGGILFCQASNAE